MTILMTMHVLISPNYKYVIGHYEQDGQIK